MKNLYWAGLVVGLLSLYSPAHADLLVSGMGTIKGVTGSYQLIYDTDLNITWLDYRNSPWSKASRADLTGISRLH
jgi:hypothetical protein